MLEMFVKSDALNLYSPRLVRVFEDLSANYVFVKSDALQDVSPVVARAVAHFRCVCKERRVTARKDHYINELH